MGKIANHCDAITPEMWSEVLPFNRKMVEEYLDNATHLSKKSHIQYVSALKIYFYWIKENKDNKKCIDIKAKDFMMYQNSLYKRGLSEAGMKLKRSAISSFNQYIMLFYEEEYPTFRNYVTKNIVVPKTGFVHKKEPLTPDEYETLCNYLRKNEMWQKLAYLIFSYSTGCRREEARQLLKEVITYEPQKKVVKITDGNGNESEMEAVAYKTHDIRCKGRGDIGKVRKLQFGEDAMEALKKWIEVRGEDDNPYVFVKKTKDGKTCEQISEGGFNYWCNTTFEKVIGRRIHPHLFRESKATNMVVHEKKSIEVAQRLLGHNSSETTKIYVITDEQEDAFDAFV